ncbi:MAG: PCP reductase family protein [Gemmatimonadota bacterium]|nr:PCP reductase family protein [Gemmatimonadota bacterium]
MKFLCLSCDEVMAFAERQLPGDGTLTAIFTCPACKREMALLTNPMETQLVTSLGVEIGGRTVPQQPMQQTRMGLDSPLEDAFEAPVTHPVARGPVTWAAEATERLEKVPSFVRGMVKRIYADYATEHGIHVITPEVMDRARSDLGLEGM